MNLRWLLNLVQAVLVTAGLSVAPMVVPAAAAQGKAAGATEMSMAADMPCCPDENRMDCQDCPLMALCVLQTAQADAPPVAALPLRYGVRTAHRVHHDATAAGLDRPPPDQPPRNLI
jgi:hypothetical protein